MKRNPDATCATCPFWLVEEYDPHSGKCRRQHPAGSSTTSEQWCGEHPQFFAVERRLRFNQPSYTDLSRTPAVDKERDVGLERQAVDEKQRAVASQGVDVELTKLGERAKACASNLAIAELEAKVERLKAEVKMWRGIDLGAHDERARAEDLIGLLEICASGFSGLRGQGVDIVAETFAAMRYIERQHTWYRLVAELSGLTGFLGVLANGQTSCGTRHPVAQRYLDALSRVVTGKVGPHGQEQQ